MSTMAVRFIALGCVALASLSGAFAQVRDQHRSQPKGTAAISGVLVSDEDVRTPVRRAIVSLSGAELPLSRAVITDVDGRFAFTDLAAGRFTLKASKGGFLTTTLGAKRAGRQGTVLVLAAGERIADVTFRIPRAAVIAGTITSPTGDPMPGLQISAVSVHAPELQPYSLTSIGFLTDDRGVYRIFGLTPGDYYVVALPPRQMAAGAGIAVARSAAEIDAIFRQLRDMTNGTAGGAPAPRSPGRPAAPDAETPPAYGYAPIFYPGTPNGADAAIVSVAAGQERQGADLIVERVRTAEIEGVVTNPHGPLPRVILSIAPRGPQLRGVYGGSPVLPQPVGPDGRFRYSGVAPGQYTLYVRASGVPPSPSGRMGGGVSLPGDASGQTLWAAADVTVLGEHLTISLDLQPALRVTGRIRFDVTSRAPEPFSGVRIVLAREGSTGMAAMNNTNIGTPPVAPAMVRADGTFELGGILPGTYLLSATVPMAKGWWARSAIVDGRDLLDVPLVIERDTTNVALTFSDLETELFGQVTGAGDAPAYETALVVFPADPALWRKGARRVQTATAASDGRFSIRGLPGGEYLLALLPDVEQHQLHDRAFLEQLARASLKFTLADGEKKRQDVRLR